MLFYFSVTTAATKFPAIPTWSSVVHKTNVLMKLLIYSVPTNSIPKMETVCSPEMSEQTFLCGVKKTATDLQEAGNLPKFISTSPKFRTGHYRLEVYRNGFAYFQYRKSNGQLNLLMEISSKNNLS
jgi:hypothetical protein